MRALKDAYHGYLQCVLLEDLKVLWKKSAGSRMFHFYGHNPDVWHENNRCFSNFDCGEVVTFYLSLDV